MPEQLGDRLSRLRGALGWTQQELAERIGVSRVAISHFEMGLQVPSERTIALLAGIFGVEPAALVAGTRYPPAKAERLPPVVARYTALEHELALLDRDLLWIERIAALPHAAGICREVLHAWIDRLAALSDSHADRRSRQQIETARSKVQQAIHAQP